MKDLFLVIVANIADHVGVPLTDDHEDFVDDGVTVDETDDSSTECVDDDNDDSAAVSDDDDDDYANHGEDDGD